VDVDRERGRIPVGAREVLLVRRRPERLLELDRSQDGIWIDTALLTSR
jgi:hypothetical protein